MTTQVPARTAEKSRGWLSRDPFSLLRDELEDLFGRLSTEWNGGRAPEFAPSLDLCETESALRVRLDLPGVKPEDVDIEVSGNTLRISGQRVEEKEEKGQLFHRMERRSGSFTRSLSLPCAVQEDKVEAEYRDGVLTVTLPKTEEARSRKIKIKSK